MTAPADRQSAARVVFLDNLRTLMVLLVVVVHVCCAYSKYTFWWYVNDANAAAVDLLLGILDVFAMPVLYFIAGYFAPPSLHGRGGPRGFVRGKLRRLGLPLLVGVVLVTPVPPYIKALLGQGAFVAPGYGSHLGAYWGTVFSPVVRIIDSTEAFNQNHFWFISLLLLFFLLWAGWRALRGGGPAARRPATLTSTSTALSLVSGLAFPAVLVGFLLFSRPENPEPWVLIGGAIQFQPTRLPLYVLYFLLGLHAWRRDWFGAGRGIGGPAIWLPVLAGLLAAYLLLIQRLETAYSEALGVLYLLVRTLLCQAFLLAFLAAARRWWDRPTPLNRLLARSSYDIYLAHYLIVIALQAVLFTLWPRELVALKLVLVVPLAVLASLGLSRYLILPRPRTFVAGLATLTALAALLVGPA